MEYDDNEGKNLFNNKESQVMKKLAKKNISSIMKSLFANQLITKSKDNKVQEVEKVKEEEIEEKKNNEEGQDENKTKGILENLLEPKKIQTENGIQSIKNPQYSHVPLKNPNYIFQSVTFNNSTNVTPQNIEQVKSNLYPQNEIKVQSSFQNNFAPMGSKILNSKTTFRIITKNEYERLLKDPSAKIVKEKQNFDFKNRSKTRDLKKESVSKNNFFNVKETTVVNSGYTPSNKVYTKTFSKSQIRQKKFINSTQTSRKFIQTSVLTKNTSQLNINNYQNSVYYNQGSDLKKANPLFTKYANKKIFKNGTNIFHSSILRN